MQKQVLALGFFDGVHLGHGALFRKARDYARDRGLRSCAVTFEEPPMTRITGRPVPLLCSPRRRKELILQAHGMDALELLPFDDAMMHKGWEAFLAEELYGRLQAAALVAGDDYTFGWRGEGTVARLRGWCADHGLDCFIIPAQRIDGIRVSSTYIRGLVSEGNMERAALFLGHPYRIGGIVRPGQGLGHAFGFPTVNIPLPDNRQWPVFGVYRTRVTVGGATYDAITNVGRRPTVAADGQPVIESTLLDFDRDVYGERVDVDFYAFIRPEQKFASVEALTAQVHRDIESVRKASGHP